VAGKEEEEEEEKEEEEAEGELLIGRGGSVGFG
jgi:hypothetical protein